MVVALCPGARFRQKDWGGRRYAELIQRIADGLWFMVDGKKRPVVVLLLGGKEDRERCEEIKSKAQAVTPTPPYSDTPILNLAGELSVLESVSVIEQSDLCVGNDTFGLHAAIAMNTPSVVVMWGGDYGRWKPWGDPEKHMMVSKPMDCFGCRGNCIHPTYECMEKIAVEDVLQHINDLSVIRAHPRNPRSK
jgi:heptosyltransferase-2/heptosyltransferase-3